MLTGSPLELVVLFFAPAVGLLALVFSSTLRDSVPARRVLAVIAVLSLLEFTLYFMTVMSIGSP